MQRLHDKIKRKQLSVKRILDVPGCDKNNSSSLKSSDMCNKNITTSFMAYAVN